MKGEFQILYKKLLNYNIQLSFIKVAVVVFTLIGLDYQFVEGFNLIAYVNYISAALNLFLYYPTLRKKIPLEIITHLIILIFYLNVIICSYYFLSIGLTTLYWYSIIPLLALMIGDIRLAVAWGAISLLTIILLTTLVSNDLLPYIDKRNINMFSLTDQIQIIITVLIFVYFNNKLYKKVVENILETNENLSEAKNKIEETQQSKDLFFANISHELRTPLNSIIGTSTLLKTKNQDPTVHEDIENIHFSSKLLLKIINDILDLSKLNDKKFFLNPSDENLKQSIENVYQLLHLEMKEKKIDYQLHFSDNFPEYAHFDKMRVIQIILNFLSNAKKFTDKGSIKIYGLLEANTISISVEDTGIGIDENFIGDLFKNYVQEDKSISKKYGGTGLGLSISYKLAKLMNGDILCQSQKGIGSKFTFKFPYIAAEPPAEKTNFLAAETSIKENLSILIADDNHMNLFIVKKLFNNHFKNYTIYTATNGLEVIEQFYHIPSIDLILMDIQMPEMDGLEATKKIRENNQDVKIIALTASSTDNLVEECKQAGMNGYVIKPFELDQLIDAIHQVFLGKFYI